MNEPAWQPAYPSLLPPRKRHIGGKLWIPFAVLGALFAALLCAVVIRFFWTHPYSNLRAFRVPGGSMCPTICPNERIIAATDAYAKGDPSRGEVILFSVRQQHAPFVRRVIGVAGDIVSPGPGKTLLVNGHKLEWPPVCAKPNSQAAATSELQFAEVKVPSDSYFVVGDNLDNSLDTRTAGFGFVRREQVSGKALMIYWAPDSSRIGCDVK